MKVSSSRKIRLYIKVTIDGKTCSSYIKTRIFDFVQRELSPKTTVEGSCLIVYDGQNDYCNEFRFVDMTSFRKSLTSCTELPLLEYLGEKI